MLDEMYNNKNVDIFDELLAEDHIDHNAIPGQQPGREGVKKATAELFASAEVSVVIHDVIAEADKVVTRYTVTMIHGGDFMGLPAAGKRTDLEVIQIDRVENGKLVEGWGQYDQLGMLAQLGIQLPT
jgi:predicted ester cyclase